MGCKFSYLTRYLYSDYLFTYFPCFDLVNITSCRFPFAVHNLHTECFDLTKTSLTTRGHCSSSIFLLPKKIIKKNIKYKVG